MGRKSKYIQKLTAKDEKMLRAMSRVGYLNGGMLKTQLHMADRRILNFQRDGYIEKVSYIEKSTKEAYFAYRLSNRGRALCEKELKTNYFYRSSSPEHDMKLGQLYLSLNEEQKESWMCESEWRNQFKQHLVRLREQDSARWQEVQEQWEKGLFSPPDGGYMSEGVPIAVEVVTGSYGEADIQAKEAFANELRIEYTQIRV